MKLNSGQKKALKLMQNGSNVFLTGGAGTGKTFLLHYFLDSPKIKSKNILVCAPTGVAALQAGGSTLHRTFGIPIKALDPMEDVGDISDSLKSAEIIVVDEISMCRVDVFQFFTRKIIKAEKESKIHKQIILIGDFFQLPPVVLSKKKVGERYSDRDILAMNYGTDASDGFPFSSPCWSILGFKTAILTEIVRQKDSKFAESLNMLRVGVSDGLKWINDNSASEALTDAITLCSRNDEAAEINSKKLSGLRGKIETYNTITTGEKIKASDMPVPLCLKLKVGCRVMSLVNDRNKLPLYSNGSLGTIVKMQHSNESNENCITVAFDNGNTIDLKPYTWEITRYIAHKEKGKVVVQQEVIATITQYPLQIAYAVTIHKAQGQSYEKLIVEPKNCFLPGHLYVALSRATTIMGLSLASSLCNDQLICSDKVKAFYNGNISLDITDLTAEQKEIIQKIKSDVLALPYYQQLTSQPAQPASTIKPKARGSVSTKRRNNIPNSSNMKKSPIAIIFESSSTGIQKSFLAILSVLSKQNVTKENYICTYDALSETKKSIARASLF